MLKKVLAAGLALLLLGLTACGGTAAPAATAAPQSSAPADTAAEAPAPTPEEETEAPTLREQVEALGPANKHDALALALQLFSQKVRETTEAMEAAGLAEQAEFQDYLVDWSALAYERVLPIVELYADRDEEELAGLADDASYMTLWELYMKEMDEEYTRMNTILQDPQQWAELAKGSDTAAVDHETDGSWPAGFFFSDRVPEIEGFDVFKTTTAGRTYGVADAEEGALFFLSLANDRMQAYIDELLAAGAVEQSSAISGDTVTWVGKIEDEAGCVSILAIQDSTAAGTPENPQGILMYCNWDYYVVMEEAGVR